MSELAKKFGIGSRDIKFRFWYKRQNFMEHGCFTDLAQKIDWSERWNVVCMQYTGLKDQNGKEIYEGDVVEMDGFKTKFIVSMNDGIYMAMDTDNDMEDYLHECECEIVGNIFENPELIENA